MGQTALGIRETARIYKEFLSHSCMEIQRQWSALNILQTTPKQSKTHRCTRTHNKIKTSLTIQRSGNVRSEEISKSS
eukprot:13891713-Ditylum_brightwellii.AAC.1